MRVRSFSLSMTLALVASLSACDSGSGGEDPDRGSAEAGTAGERIAQHREQARAEGRTVGIGLACYVEGTGVGPYEGGHVRVELDGRRLVLGARVQGSLDLRARIRDVPLMAPRVAEAAMRVAPDGAEPAVG